MRLLDDSEKFFLPTAGVPIWPSQLRLPCSFKRILGDETPQFEAAQANASFTGVANDAPLRHILSFRSLGNAPVDAVHACRSGLCESGWRDFGAGRSRGEGLAARNQELDLNPLRQ